MLREREAMLIPVKGLYYRLSVKVICALIDK
jgi:hypothetical protein